jgi:hypothetical protein
MAAADGAADALLALKTSLSRGGNIGTEAGDTSGQRRSNEKLSHIRSSSSFSSWRSDLQAIYC